MRKDDVLCSEGRAGGSTQLCNVVGAMRKVKVEGNPSRELSTWQLEDLHSWNGVLLKGCFSHPEKIEGCVGHVWLDSSTLF